MKVDITVNGNSESDILIALDEIKNKIGEGYTSGKDGNDTGDYYFNIEG